MDSSMIRKSAKTLPDTNASSNSDNVKFSNRNIPPYLKDDGHYQTNSQINVKYIRTCTGALLPIISAKRPAVLSFDKRNSNLKSSQNSSDNSNPGLNEPKRIGSEIRRFLKSARSDSELGKFIQNIQYHKREDIPPKK